MKGCCDVTCNNRGQFCKASCALNGLGYLCLGMHYRCFTIFSHEPNGVWNEHCRFVLRNWHTGHVSGSGPGAEKNPCRCCATVHWPERVKIGVSWWARRFKMGSLGGPQTGHIPLAAPIRDRQSNRPRDALEGKGPQRRPEKRLERRLQEVTKAVEGGYCRLQMPLRLALAVRGTVAGHWPSNASLAM